jgi:hypothetical protein
MTIAQKVFWFFAVCLVGNIALSMAGVAPVNTYSTKDPVPDMSREAQCSRDDTYVWSIQYGSTREVAWSDCKTGQLIKVKKY